MSKFGKFLVVFLLLLSAVFAGAQMVLYAKRANYYEQLQTAKDQAAREKKTADAEITTLTSRIQDKEKAVAQQNTEIAGLKADVNRYQISNAKNVEALNAAAAAQKDLRNSINEQVAVNKESIKRITDLTAFKENLEKELRDGMAKIDALSKENQNKADMIAKLNGQVSDLEKVKTDLADALNKAEAKIRRYVMLGVALPEEEVPIVDGRVLKVDNDLKVVVLSVGKNSGVKVAHKFTVYRGNQFIAEVIVNYVGENTCVAQPLLKEPGKNIQVGDAATTRI